ncbi:MAG: dihydrolipoamide acetyltransferase family protein [Proteobacteria bacterium]|nr:dihydrolipoamide acetyltransferase family protein [Pseudomonadota bacterium]
MAKIIVMPKLSDTMEEGAVANWLKKEGESIDEGQDLVEIETDKATMAFASNAEGVVLKILLEPKKTAALGTPLCVIGAKGEKYNLEELLSKLQAAPGAKGPAPKPAATSSTSAPASSPTPQSAESKSASTNGGRVKASPLAKKMAADKGLDLTTVQGSGPAGRIVAKDIETANAGGRSQSMGTTNSSFAVAADRVIPLSMMRKTIAKRLLQGKNEAPHFYLTVSADMTRMNDWRTRLNKDAESSKDKSVVKVSVNDLVTMAVAKALAKHPSVNASWQQDSIIEFGGVHVCMAVALPTGLVTPVIRHTNLLSIRDIAAKAKELAGKAKDGKLTNEDYLGGTFTISNLGMFGIEEFTAIINPPQAAILAVGGTMVTPVVNASGDIVAKPIMKMTLSCDHRVIDGAMGAQFLKTLVEHIEEPMTML